jgi:hypothetical protein
MYKQYLISHTILPSPLPKSINFPFRPLITFKTFWICKLVAGTYGKHTFRKAGDMNG